MNDQPRRSNTRATAPPTMTHRAAPGRAADRGRDVLDKTTRPARRILVYAYQSQPMVNCSKRALNVNLTVVILGLTQWPHLFNSICGVPVVSDPAGGPKGLRLMTNARPLR